MFNDLCAAAEGLRSGQASALAVLRQAQEAAQGPANAGVFTGRFDTEAETAAKAIDGLRAARAPLPPLAGLPVSVKALFDVAGHVTAAGSRVLADAPAAAQDATAVARLRAAGAVLVGHTNMTEFAFSGVGINPHYGTPANPIATRQRRTARIPGGSTSGGAVSVATGAAWAALGSDTGGSIRIPAALQGLVGFKNTQALTPRDGCVPLSTTLDTSCAITLSVRDAVLVHEVLSARSIRLPRRPLRSLRLAVPQGVMVEQLDATVARAHERALRQLRRLGAQIDDIELPPLAKLSTLQAGGGFAAAESWAWHRKLLADRQQDYDPRVAARIRRGEAISAADYIDLQQARAAWMAEMSTALAPFDALLSPTVPIVAPEMQPLIDSDDAFFAANALLLRNPSVVNQLDGCALSLPCHSPDELPVGLMVWSSAGRDDTVLDVSLALEIALAAGRAES